MRYNTWAYYMVICYQRFSNSDENDRKQNNRKQLRYISGQLFVNNNHVNNNGCS